jgi:lysophospholipase L1-like esterase
MRSKLSVCVALSALVCLLPGAALAKSHKPKKKKAPISYYLALGDSLSRGAQPNAQGVTVPTNQGYANVIYASEKKKIKGLKLEQLGCVGETTTTMLSGGICHYAAGSQQKAALKFIAKHKIALITLDIGANDIDNCVSATTGIDSNCIASGTTSIGTNVPTIVAQLRHAAGSKVKMAAMTYYDPFLATYLEGTNAGQTEAVESVLLAKDINGTLSSDYAAQHFRVADVATAFDVYMPFTSTVSEPSLGGTVPVAVAETCALTWMCTPAPVGPNIHANVAGYKEIARVFAAAL